MQSTLGAAFDEKLEKKNKNIKCCLHLFQALLKKFAQEKI